MVHRPVFLRLYDMNGIAELCRDLATLHAALSAATTPAGRVDDRSTVARLVAATLVATPRHDGSNIRKVPASRPVADIVIIDCAVEMTTDVLDCARQIRRAFHHRTRDWRLAQALDATARLYPGLPDGDPLAKTVWNTLYGHRRRAVQTLGIGRRWHVLGECPVPREPYEAAWDESGTQVTHWWMDGVCRTYDVNSYYAVMRGAPADSWFRSRLRVDADADPYSRAGDIRCFGCGSRWRYDSNEWRRLGMMMAAAG
jgi:hypothetical protein